MNKHAFKIMALHNKFEKNKSLSKKLKVLAVVCLFFSFCYCFGSANIAHLDKSEGMAANFVWIISVLVLVGIYIKDAQCIKANKVAEFEIYRLEVEDLNTQKEVARITGDKLSDYIYDKHVVPPDGSMSLPVAYYGILIGIDIIVRICLFLNYMI